MRANVVGHGSFGNRVGGGRPWLEFRIVLESAGLFHGELISAGFDFLRDSFDRCALMLTEAKHLCSITLHGVDQKADPRFVSTDCGIRMRIGSGR